MVSSDHQASSCKHHVAWRPVLAGPGIPGPSSNNTMAVPCACVRPGRAKPTLRVRIEWIASTTRAATRQEPGRSQACSQRTLVRPRSATGRTADRIRQAPWNGAGSSRQMWGYPGRVEQRPVIDQVVRLRSTHEVVNPSIDQPPPACSSGPAAEYPVRTQALRLRAPCRNCFGAGRAGPGCTGWWHCWVPASPLLPAE